MIRFWKEVCLNMLQSIKMLVKGKQTILLLTVSLLLLTAMLFSMDEVKEEKSKIYIGMVNQDGDELVETVISGMTGKEMYEVIRGSEKELVSRLTLGELSAVCVFSEGYTEKICNGKTKNLVTIYETESGEALLLGDILAGVMMQEICTAKGYLTLISYAEKAGKVSGDSVEEYRSYVNRILESGGTEFFFDVSYVSGTGEIAKKPSQTVIYEQAIFAVFALMTGLIAIYSVLPFRQMRHGRLAERVKTLPLHGSAVYLGSALAGLVIPMLFGGMFLLLFSVRNQIEFSKNISLLICTVVYSCVIVCMMLLAAYIIRNQTVYQMGMLAMILLFGIFGLISLADGFLLPEGVAVWVPNGWYVRKMTEILHQ